MSEVEKHIKILSENKIPKNFKGDEFKVLEYVLDGRALIVSFFDAMMANNTFKGELIIHSNLEIFDDSLGFKLGLILEKDNLESLTVKNKDSPFSDRVTSYIGDVISKCKNLKKLEMYMDVGVLSYNHILQFLMNPESSLETLRFLKISEDFIVRANEFSAHFYNSCRLADLQFYYEPLTKLNLMYRSNKSKGIIAKENYESFSDVIQLLPRLTTCKVIPWYGLDIRKSNNQEMNLNNSEVKNEKSNQIKQNLELENQNVPTNNSNLNNKANDNLPLNEELVNSIKTNNDDKINIKENSIPKNSPTSIPSEISLDLKYEEFEEFNKELREDIEKINITFEFACNLNTEKKKYSSNIEKMFNEENLKMCKIM